MSEELTRLFLNCLALGLNLLVETFNQLLTMLSNIKTLIK